MTDLVPRLRATATMIDGLLQLVQSQTPLDPLAANVREAADEIERSHDKFRHIKAWLKQNAGAETEPNMRQAFIEAHNAVLAIIEGRA